MIVDYPMIRQIDIAELEYRNRVIESKITVKEDETNANAGNA